MGRAPGTRLVVEDSRPEVALLRFLCFQRELSDEEIARAGGTSKSVVRNLWMNAERSEHALLRLDSMVTAASDEQHGGPSRGAGLGLPEGSAEEFQEWLSEHWFRDLVA